MPRVGTDTTSRANGSCGGRASSALRAATRPSARSARWTWGTGRPHPGKRDPPAPRAAPAPPPPGSGAPPRLGRDVRRRLGAEAGDQGARELLDLLAQLAPVEE